MASSRDDFVIAIRSAFLKKSTKQKFSLLTLIFFSIFIIVLSNFNFKAISVTKSIIKEIVYRSSFIVSIPENLAKIRLTYFASSSALFVMKGIWTATTFLTPALDASWPKSSGVR